MGRAKRHRKTVSINRAVRRALNNQRINYEIKIAALSASLQLKARAERILRMKIEIVEAMERHA